MQTHTVEETYLHKYDHYWRDAEGNWIGPEVRYHDESTSEAEARALHMECNDVEYTWDTEFEGIWGYRWVNCRLVKKTVLTVTEIEPI